MFVAVCLLTAAPAFAADDAVMLRVFLKDGTSLMSYGEMARVDSRVVFSMPTSASMADPRLHLVNIGADRVDWERTTRYAESARAARYLDTRAETDYAILTGHIASALADVTLTTDSGSRLAVAERARKTLADWGPSHFNYRQAEVRQMLGILDEAIAELRAAAGVDRFDLNFVTTTDTAPVWETLLPPPTPKEAIEQTLMAARLTDSPAERVSLLTVALVSMGREATALPAEWVIETRTATRRELGRELSIDRRYRALTSQMMSLAARRARAADVRGVQRVLIEIGARDKGLGANRPDAVNVLIAAVEGELDTARRLRLARDRWALRLPTLRAYSTSISRSIDRLDRLKPSLEDIKSLSGSAPDRLALLERGAAQILGMTSAIVPPEEFRAAHALLLSAVHLADNAARIRREAALSGNMPRAWDASSAAAGALMLTERARAEIQALIRLPQLPR